jgi:hypothetical protein
MEASLPSASVLRRAFADICNGYSSVVYKGKTVYLKHLGHRERLDVDDKRDFYESKAIKDGLPTEAQRIQKLKDRGLWLSEKDEQIKDKIAYIKRLENSAKAALLQSQRETQNARIKEEKEKLTKLEFQRDELIGLTAESYAQQQVNDYYIVKNVYRDEELKQSLFNDAEFEDLGQDDVSELISLYNRSAQYYDDYHIKQLVIQDFFQTYYFLANDNLFRFFGKPICELTFNQVRLGNYARYFKGMFENNEINKLPEDVQKDAEKLEAYISAAKKGKEALDSAGEGSMVSIPGATAKDIEAMGAVVAKFPDKPMNKEETLKFLGVKA